jgi:hypothetical protein
MQIPEDFRFSQNNLQDYLDCPRRFELRYLQNLKWPAVESQPVLEHEHYMEQGQLFHQMVYQHQVGIPEDVLSLSVSSEIRSWWENYLAFVQNQNLVGTKFPEFLLSVPFEGFRLIAKYDLLVISNDGEAQIFDWKTNRKRSSSTTLSKRMQTIIYPLVLALAAENQNQFQGVQPEKIKMIYWFTAAPAQPEVFEFSQEKYISSKILLSNLIQEIKRTEKFEKTVQERNCKFCVYRSLCDRGIMGGEWSDQEEETDQDWSSDFDFSFDDLDEVAL